MALLLNVAARAIPFFAAGMLLWAVNAAASWPSQPIRWIVPFPPGGGTDFVARLIGNHLDKLLGQPIIVENKPGGATVTGTAALVQAAPDGHTVGMVFDSLAINAALGLIDAVRSGARQLSRLLNLRMSLWCCWSIRTWCRCNRSRN